MTREELYRLQVAATAALLLSAIRRGVIDLTRSGPESAATDAGPTSDRATAHSVPHSAARVQS